MNIAKKIGSLLGEIVSHPTGASYIFEKGGTKVVVRPGGDYSGTDLSGLNLKGLNLRGTNFQGANLSKVDFSGAHLEDSDLTNATLIGTVLSGAHLEGAKFDPDGLIQAVLESTPSGLSPGLAKRMKSEV